jgi:hypothetical protein
MAPSPRPRFFAPFAYLCFALFVALGATGCAATSDYMLEVKPPRAVVATPGMAMVVFVRPSSWGAAIKTTILDERGAFLGDSLSASHFAVSLPPGPHVFISWAENTAALQATLAQGRIYFVEVAPRPGFLSARAHLLAITPRRETWAKLGDWLAETRQFTPDPAGGERHLQERAEDVTERVRRAQEVLRKYDAEELEARTIRPEDGR